MIRPWRGLIHNQSGMALVVALILMVVLMLAGIASTLSSTFEVKLSGNKRGSTDAFFAADSAVQILEGNVQNFMTSKYVDHQYNPYTVTNTSSPDYNPNPTKAQVTIQHDPSQQGCPRGIGMGTSQFEFIHFVIDSTGNDQMDVSLIRSTSRVQEKVVRLLPTMQGGN